jgi:protein-disulfide isomerase
MWGKRDAPVTIVIYSDFQCPYCSRVEPTLDQVRQTYGPDKVRIVWKNNPCPSTRTPSPPPKRRGRLRARGQRRVLEVSRHGVQKPERAFRRQLREVGQGRRREGRLAEVQGGPREPQVGGQGRQGPQRRQGCRRSGHARVLRQRRLHQRRAAVRQVQEDDRSGAPEGAGQDRERHVEDPRLRRDEQGEQEKPARRAKDDEATRKTRRRSSRSRSGRARRSAALNALVTIVEFSDFQCPFCSRVEPTLKALRDKYGDKVRLVWKNEPLPFHPARRARRRSALEVRAEKGDKGFWDVHDKFFGNQKDLKRSGRQRRRHRQDRHQAGGNSDKIKKAIADHLHKKDIDADRTSRRTSRRAGRRTSSSTAGASSARSRGEVREDHRRGDQEGAGRSSRRARPADVYEALIKDGKGAPEPEKKPVPEVAPEQRPRRAAT